jgi:hypothetical protein
MPRSTHALPGVLAATAATLLIFGGQGATAPVANAVVAEEQKRCGAGFIHAIVRRAHVCRAAPDLRVSVASSPQANRVGGAFTFVVSVLNAGRRPAARVALTASAPAEYVSASSAVGSCTVPPGPLRAACPLGNLAPRARATTTIIVNAVALGRLRLTARASSPTRDAHPRDNSTAAETSVTEPDFVRGYGVRPAFGGGARPPISVEVDAISGPSGHDPAGTFTTKYPLTNPSPFELRGRVVCLTVQANRASVGGVVEQSNDPTLPPGSRVQFEFTDNGDPGVGRDTELSYFSQETTTCTIPIFPGQDFPQPALIEGNYTIRDVQP